MVRRLTVSTVFTLAVMMAVPTFAQAEGTPAAPEPTGVPAAPAPVAESAPAPAPSAAAGQQQYAYRMATGRVLVLPFVTLNAPEKQLWIGRAVQEDIVADFGKNRMLSPVASDAASEVEDNATAASLAHKTNANYVIRGAAQFVDKNLRLTAQLIDAQSGNTVATASATGPATDLLKLEDQLSGQLRSASLSVARAPAPQPYGNPNPYAPVPYGPYEGQQAQAGAEGATPYTPGYSPYYTEPYYPQPMYYGADYSPYYGPYAYDNYDYSYPYYAGFYSVPFIAYGGFGFGFNRFCFPRDFRHVRFSGRGVWNHGGGWNVNGGGFRGGGWDVGHPNVSYSTTFAGGFNSGGIRSFGFHSALSPVRSAAPSFSAGFHTSSFGSTGFGGFRGGGFSGGVGGGFHGGGFSGGFGGGGRR